MGAVGGDDRLDLELLNLYSSLPEERLGRPVFP